MSFIPSSWMRGPSIDGGKEENQNNKNKVVGCFILTRTR